MEIAAVTAASYFLSKSRLGLISFLGGPTIDNPLVRPTPGQRMVGDLQITDTVEGAAENRCFGPQNRVAGALVWMSDLKEVKKTESGGGKGGSGGEFITYQYFAHCMVRLCRAREPVSRITKIWADAKLLFDVDTDLAYSSNGIDTSTQLSITYQGGGIGTLPTQIQRNYLVLSSDVLLGNPDLSKLKSGNAAVVSGYTGGTVVTGLKLEANPTVGATSITLKSVSGTIGLSVGDVLEFTGFDMTYSVKTAASVTTTGVPVALENTIVANRPIGSVTAPVVVQAKRGAQANNGTFTVVAATINPDPSVSGGVQLSQVRLTDNSNGFRKFTAVAAGSATVAITQTNPTFKASQVSKVQILTGGPDQAVPAVLQRIEGAAVSQVYAMRNRAGFVLEDLNLTDSGNRLPNLEGNVEVTSDPGLVADAIKTVLMDDADWAESAIDVSGVTGSFLGFTIRGPQPPSRSLLPLLAAFDVVRWETGGKLYFANRSAIPVVTIPASEIGAWADQQDKRGLQVTDPSRDMLPSEINLSYRSPSKDYQVVTKRSKRAEAVPVNIATVDLSGLVLSDDVAQQTADRMLALAWGAQRRFALPLPQSRAGAVRAGMILSFGPVYGQNWKVFLDRVDRGANMLVLAQGQEYDPALSVQAQTTEGSLGLSLTANSQDGGHTTQAPVELFLMDTPTLRDQDRSEPGIYVAARSSDPARPYRGGVLYWSIDYGVTWARVADVAGEAITGEVVTAPSVTVLPGMWDRANTIRIKIRNQQAQLGSVSTDACLAGANRFLIGTEIIGAANVVFVESDPVDGSKTYDLSMLLRGQQDTDQEMGGHVVDEAVVWLDGPGVQFLPLGFSHVDNPRTWKLVPHGGFLDDAPHVAFTPRARNCRPFHVRDVRATRDGSNNITVAFERMTRAARTFLVHGAPLDEEVESYEIDVMDGADVVRTIAVTGARTFAYSHANGVADGLDTADPVTMRFYQMSAGLLRGAESEYEV